MTTAPTQDVAGLAADYWHTDIIDIEPGHIHVHGYSTQELIGQIDFAKMIQLMLHGELPARQQAVLLKAALVASVDYGLHTPSIAVTKMATSYGLPLNGAMAPTLNALDDVHGGAGQQAVGLFYDIEARMFDGASLEAVTAVGVNAFIAVHGKYSPGFGHHFHPVDPQVGRLPALVDEATQDDVVDGWCATIGRATETLFSSHKDKPIPMNIDGATAVIYVELDFAAPLVRGVFRLLRAAGTLAHAWE